MDGLVEKTIALARGTPDWIMHQVNHLQDIQTLFPSKDVVRFLSSQLEEKHGIKRNVLAFSEDYFKIHPNVRDSEALSSAIDEIIAQVESVGDIGYEQAHYGKFVNASHLVKVMDDTTEVLAQEYHVDFRSENARDRFFAQVTDTSLMTMKNPRLKPDSVVSSSTFIALYNFKKNMEDLLIYFANHISPEGDIIPTNLKVPKRTRRTSSYAVKKERTYVDRVPGTDITAVLKEICEFDSKLTYPSFLKYISRELTADGAKVSSQRIKESYLIDKQVQKALLLAVVAKKDELKSSGGIPLDKLVSGDQIRTEYVLEKINTFRQLLATQGINSATNVAVYSYLSYQTGIDITTFQRIELNYLTRINIDAVRTFLEYMDSISAKGAPEFPREEFIDKRINLRKKESKSRTPNKSTYRPIGEYEPYNNFNDRINKLLDAQVLFDERDELGKYLAVRMEQELGRPFSPSELSESYLMVLKKVPKEYSVCLDLILDEAKDGLLKPVERKGLKVSTKSIDRLLEVSIARIEPEIGISSRDEVIEFMKGKAGHIHESEGTTTSMFYYASLHTLALQILNQEIELPDQLLKSKIIFPKSKLAKGYVPLKGVKLLMNVALQTVKDNYGSFSSADTETDFLNELTGLSKEEVQRIRDIQTTDLARETSDKSVFDSLNAFIMQNRQGQRPDIPWNYLVNKKPEGFRNNDAITHQNNHLVDAGMVGLMMIQYAYLTQTELAEENLDKAMRRTTKEVRTDMDAHSREIFEGSLYRECYSKIGDKIPRSVYNATVNLLNRQLASGPLRETPAYLSYAPLLLAENEELLEIAIKDLFSRTSPLMSQDEFREGIRSKVKIYHRDENYAVGDIILHREMRDCGVVFESKYDSGNMKVDFLRSKEEILVKGRS